MTRFKTVKPVMVYLEPQTVKELKWLSKRIQKPVSEIAREAINVRLSPNPNSYMQGLWDGLHKAVSLALKTQGARMMFPDGKSWGEMVEEAVESYMVQRFRGMNMELRQAMTQNGLLREEAASEQPQEDDAGHIRSLPDGEPEQPEEDNAGPADVWGELHR